MKFSLGWGTGQVRSPSIDELLPKHALLAQIGINMCPVVYWKVPVWAVGWQKSQPVSTSKPSVTGQSLNFMRLLCLQFHSQVPPGQEHPRTKKSPIEKHWVMSQDGGGVWCSQHTRGQGRKRPKKYTSLCISPRMAAYDCGVGAK